MMTILASGGGLVLSLLLTSLYLPVARRWQFLDTPNARSAHTQLTPSSGGLAIAAAFLLSTLMAAGMMVPGLSVELFVLLGTSVTVVCGLGAIDDFRPLSIAVRMPIFLGVSAVTVYVFDPLFPAWGVFALAVEVLAFAWLLNLYNFMDGIDGIAASQTVLVALGLAVVGTSRGAAEEFVLTCMMAATCYAAFLRLNWAPARLFMGDSGSLSAGYIIGFLGLWGVQEDWLPMASWCLLMSPFLLDTGVTLLRRTWHRERLTHGHNKHYYQRLSRHLGNHQLVVKRLILLQLFWLMPLAWLESLQLAVDWTFALVGLFPQLLLIVKYRHLK